MYYVLKDSRNAETNPQSLHVKHRHDKGYSLLFGKLDRTKLFTLNTLHKHSTSDLDLHFLPRILNPINH